MPELPTGTVTFLLTDVEGSTRLWEEHPVEAKTMLARHDEVVEELVPEHDGVVVRPRGEGDSRFAVFARATDAVAAALETQLAFAKEPWPVPLKVRAALHTGEADLRAGDYYGPAVNRCARIRALAHGGQSLVSGTTEELTRDALPDGAWLRDLGAHRLKDLTRLEQVFQLCHADLDEDFPVLGSIDMLPNNLPVQLTSLVGRDDEIREVRKLLGEHRLVTLTGAAGCGKTRLALAVGADELESFPEGVWFVDLAPVADPHLVAQVAARALGVSEEASRPPSDTLVDFLRDRRLLLILDNCEHLLETAARLATDVLVACPEVRVLTTGREALGVAGETPWRVPSLAVPDPGREESLEALTQYDAVRLFLYRARAAAPDLQVGDDAASAVAQICARLDGIPLAIELAAARADFLTPRQIASRIDDRFKLLTGGSRTALERQQTLRAALDWSYALLTDDERVLFRRLAVFVGGFSLEVCEDVCGGHGIEPGDVADLLLRLVRKSLVVADRRGREARYRLLETMRQYARERLTESEEATRARNAHLAWFRSFAERGAREFEGRDQIAWFAAFDTEHDNLRAALEWALAEDHASAAAIGSVVFGFWEVRGHLTEGREWLGQILALDDLEPEARARAEASAGGLAWRQGDFKTADALLSGALSFATERGVGDLERMVLLLKAGLSVERAERDEARTLAQACLERAREAGDRRWISAALNMLGNLDTGDGWARLYREALEVARDAGDVRSMAVALSNLGMKTVARGRYDEGRALLEEAMGHLRALGMKQAMGLWRLALAGAAFQQGDHEVARALHEENAAAMRELGGPIGRSWWLGSRGVVAYIDGDLAEARRLWEEALALDREIGHVPGQLFELQLLANAATLQGDLAGAREYLGQALRIASEPWSIATTHDLLGIVERLQGNLDRAEELHAGALAVFLERESPIDLIDGFEGLASVAAERGEAERAARLFGVADGERARIGAVIWPSRKPSRERCEARAHAALGTEAFERAHGEGRSLERADAVRLALREGADA